MGILVLAYASQGAAERTGNPSLKDSPVQFVAVTVTERFSFEKSGAGTNWHLLVGEKIR